MLHTATSKYRIMVQSTIPRTWYLAAVMDKYNARNIAVREEL
ncbi:MAG: hypothetical protein WCW35_06125 [Bacteroidota bacterium]